MSQPRIIRGSIDAERAVEDLANEHKRLAGMTGADSARIDALVGDVGIVKGNIQVVGAKVDGVASSVNELRDALTVLVRHDVQVQQHAAENVILRKDVTDIGGRVQVLERQIGPLIEMRTWVIGGGLGILALIGIAVAKLVMR